MHCNADHHTQPIILTDRPDSGPAQMALGLHNHAAMQFLLVTRPGYQTAAGCVHMTAGPSRCATRKPNPHWQGHAGSGSPWLSNCCRMYECGVLAAISSALATAPFMPAAHRFRQAGQPGLQASKFGHSRGNFRSLGRRALHACGHKTIQPVMATWGKAGDERLHISSFPAVHIRFPGSVRPRIDGHRAWRASSTWRIPSKSVRTLGRIRQHQLRAKRLQHHAPLQAARRRPSRGEALDPWGFQASNRTAARLLRWHMQPSVRASRLKPTSCWRAS